MTTAPATDTRLRRTIVTSSRLRCRGPANKYTPPPEPSPPAPLPTPPSRPHRERGERQRADSEVPLNWSRSGAVGPLTSPALLSPRERRENNKESMLSLLSLPSFSPFSPLSR